VWFEIVKRHINYRSYEYERMMNRNPDRRSWWCDWTEFDWRKKLTW
jgi:hypothetical protein